MCERVPTSKYLVSVANNVLVLMSADLRHGATVGAPGFGTAVYFDSPHGTNIGLVKKIIATVN
jgi:hypothetical protein